MKKIIILILTLTTVSFLNTTVIHAAKFPYPAVVGYWGVQASEDQCATKATPLDAVENGYNVFILSFGGIAGEGVNKPSDGALNFYADGWSDSEIKGAITFPNPGVEECSGLMEILKNQIKELNEKKVVVLLSLGGADAHLPDTLPEPKDVYDAFQSFNQYLNGGTGTEQLVHGIDWDMENGVCDKEQVEWMIAVGQYFKAQNSSLIVSCAPQSTNFTPSYYGWQEGGFNAYVPLAYGMASNGTPLDAIMVQWYEPGGYRPSGSTEEAITNCVNTYYDLKNFNISGLPESKYYNGTIWNVGEWLSKDENTKRLIPGVGAGKGWNGVTDYTADTLCAVFNNMKGKFGGYMVWDAEIDSGALAKWSNGEWPLGDGFKNQLGKENPLSWTEQPTASNITKTTASVSWSATSKDSGTITYNYTVKDSTGSTIKQGTGKSADLTGLKEASYYNVNVKAVQNKATLNGKTGFNTTGTPTVPEWDPNTTYATAGTKVSYEGKIYQNKWWTKGDVPGKSNVWELVTEI